MSEYLLSFDEQGKAELLRDGETIWASDADPQVLDEFGGDYFEKSDRHELVEYLVDIGVITWAIAENELDYTGPGEDDDDEDDDDEDDEDEDEELEVEED